MERMHRSGGFTLLNFILVIVLTSIVGAVVGSIFDAFFVHQKYATIISKRQEMFYDVMSSVSGDTAWKKTVDTAANTSMDCLKDPVDFPTLPTAVPCDDTSGGSFNLYDRNGKLVIDTLTPTAGFQVSGGTCDQFVSAGNDFCPLRAELTWKPLCTTCTSKQIEITLMIYYAPTPGGRRLPFTKKFILTRNVSLTPDATMVGVGFRFSCAVVRGGVQCWGLNNEGQLGRPVGSPAVSNVPLKVPGLESGVTGLTVGYSNVCAIQNGNVKCWGRNGGQSGVGPNPTLPNLIRLPTWVPLANVTKVTTAVGHSCAIAGGAAYCWGGNQTGQLGFSDPPGLRHDIDVGSFGTAQAVLGMGSDVVSIAAASSSTCAVKADGSVMCWGLNDYRGGSNDICAALTTIEMLGQSRINPNAKLCYPFYDETSGTPPPPDISDPSVSSNPGIYGGLYTSASSPVCASFSISTRTLACNPRPIQHESFPPGSGAKEIAASYGFCVLKNDKTVACWGSNTGSLGQGPSNPNMGSRAALPVINLNDVTMVGGLANAYCAIQTGKLYCWGWNVSPINNLNMPSGGNPYWFNSRHTPTLTQVPGNVTYFSGGGIDQTLHGCAVADKKVYCWGSNDAGQLGDGTYTGRQYSPVQVTRFQ